MKKSAVIKHFGNLARAAAALGYDRSACAHWGEVIPEASAYRLQEITDGALKVNRAEYQRVREARKAERIERARS